MCNYCFLLFFKKVLTDSNLNMDTLVKEIIPDIDLGTEINTERATIRDLLSHKLGYLGYGPAWMVGLDLSYERQDYCKRLGNLKSVGFRREFRYKYKINMFYVKYIKKIFTNVKLALKDYIVYRSIAHNRQLLRKISELISIQTIFFYE